MESIECVVQFNGEAHDEVTSASGSTQAPEILKKWRDISERINSVVLASLVEGVNRAGAAIMKAAEDGTLETLIDGSDIS